MKRLHVSVAVDDLDRSIRFYAALFAAEPTVRKPDHAKWLLDDPRVNFVISARGRPAGLDHLGLQVETRAELDEVYGRLAAAGRPVDEQGAVTCCYARSEKSWIDDPSGIAWEAFLTTGDSTVYGDDADRRPPAKAGACCGSARADAAAREGALAAPGPFAPEW